MLLVAVGEAAAGGDVAGEELWDKRASVRMTGTRFADPAASRTVDRTRRAENVVGIRLATARFARVLSRLAYEEFRARRRRTELGFEKKAEQQQAGLLARVGNRVRSIGSRGRSGVGRTIMKMEERRAQDGESDGEEEKKRKRREGRWRPAALRRKRVVVVVGLRGEVKVLEKKVPSSGSRQQGSKHLLTHDAKEREQREQREQRAQVEVAVPLHLTGLLDFWILDSGLTHAVLKVRRYVPNYLYTTAVDGYLVFHLMGSTEYGQAQATPDGPLTPSTNSSYFLSFGLGERGTKNRQWASTIDHQPPTHWDCTLLLLSASRIGPGGKGGEGWLMRQRPAQQTGVSKRPRAVEKEKERGREEEADDFLLVRSNRYSRREQEQRQRRIQDPDARCHNERSPNSAPNRVSANNRCLFPILCNRPASNWLDLYPYPVWKECSLPSFFSTQYCGYLPPYKSHFVYMQKAHPPSSYTPSKTVTAPWVRPVQHGNAKTTNFNTPQGNLKSQVRLPLLLSLSSLFACAGRARGLDVPRLYIELYLPWYVLPHCRCSSPQGGFNIPVGATKQILITHFTVLFPTPFSHNGAIISRGSLRKPHIVFPVDDCAYAFAAGADGTLKQTSSPRGRVPLLRSASYSARKYPIDSAVRCSVSHPSLGKPDTMMAVRPHLGLVFSSNFILPEPPNCYHLRPDLPMVPTGVVHTLIFAHSFSKEEGFKQGKSGNQYWIPVQVAPSEDVPGANHKSRFLVRTVTAGIFEYTCWGPGLTETKSRTDLARAENVNTRLITSTASRSSPSHLGNLHHLLHLPIITDGWASVEIANAPTGLRIGRGCETRALIGGLPCRIHPDTTFGHHNGTVVVREGWENESRPLSEAWFIDTVRYASDPAGEQNIQNGRNHRPPANPERQIFLR
ncbi:hypothetical protein CCUS01_15921 [Colletotrichum cuscutae]|uniref:Uncharacterized protein n=1 Tax=Colletotrichum cuscutae TaxID=1209917 RepID=A0AAI9VEG3_9PEZI|nr:hypothetical protein CCUS01_15921 [Colletotrichum cuscutae]